MTKLFVTTVIVIFFATLVDIAILYYKATGGEMFWKIKIFPDIGGLL